VDRVVIAIQAHVVIPRQPLRGPPAHYRRHRGQGQHGGAVGLKAIGRAAAQHPVLAGVRPREPFLQLGVEISRAAKRAAGQKRGLQVVVEAFHQALGPTRQLHPVPTTGIDACA